MNKSLTKLVFVSLLLVIGISLFEFAVILKLTGHFPSSRNTALLSVVDRTKTSDTSRHVPEPTKKEELPKYSVIAKKSSVLGWQSIINLSFTNVSVTPFIGVGAINECEFVDTQGEKHKGKFNNAQYDFPKGLLPGESGEAKIPFLSLELEGGGGISYGGYKQKCAYDDQGYKTCSDIKPLRITECTVYVMSTGQASNGWGQFPLKVIFPLD